MRVAYITRAPFISGAERALQTLLRHAPSAGIDPVVICPASSPFAKWCDTQRIACVPVALAERDRRHPARWLKSVLQLALVFRREGIDVVHANQVWAFAAAGTAARLVGIPRVCHMRDEVGVEGIRWWCQSGVEAVICVSQHIKTIVTPAWRSHFGSPRRSPRVSVLVDPVETPECATPARTGDSITLGYAGQLIPAKGLIHLLDALAGLKDNSQWRLVVAGRDPKPGAPYEHECRRRVIELGLADRVTFRGFLDDIGAFYRAIDVAVVPSLEEPLGLIPLEAALHEKPAIAFSTGGLRETIRHGHTGWLVPAGDVSALRRELQTFIDNPAAGRQAGILARAAAITACDPRTHVQALAAVYEELTGLEKACA